LSLIGTIAMSKILIFTTIVAHSLGSCSLFLVSLERSSFAHVHVELLYE
jgi:hypothetical protein